MRLIGKESSTGERREEKIRKIRRNLIEIREILKRKIREIRRIPSQRNSINF